MGHIRISIVISIVILLSAPPARGRAPGVPARPNARSSAMGGTYVANGGDLDVIGYNPAFLSEFAEFDISLFGLYLRADSNLRRTLSFMVDNREFFELFERSPHPRRSEAADFVRRSASITGRVPDVEISPTIGGAFRHLGLCVYNVTRTEVWVDTTSGWPRAFGRSASDIVASIGYGNAIPIGGISLGVALKFISRELAGPVEIPSASMGSEDDILREVQRKLGRAENGFSTDLGINLRLKEGLISLVFRDLISRIGDSSPHIDARLGSLISPFDFLCLVGEIDDLLNYSGRPASERSHLGAELRFPVLRLRGGIDRGDLTLGIGIEYGTLALRFACREKSGGMDRMFELRLGW